MILHQSAGRSLQSTPRQGAPAGPKLHSAQSDHPCWQMRPRRQRQYLGLPPGDHRQMAAGAQQPRDPQGAPSIYFTIGKQNLTNC